MSSKPQRTPLMAGNWKMNLNHLEAIQLVQKLAFALDAADYDSVEVVVLPPFTDLRSVQTLVDGDKLLLKYGAQDLSPHANGAYTGDISGPMLAKLGCSYVVIGHSERREYHHETDDVVNAKVKAAFANDITPILCVGEPLEVRQAGTHVDHVLKQLEGALNGITATQAETLVVAYEPIWAIGTGEVATPEDAQEVCGAIRTRLAELYAKDLAEAIRVLYGGSVKAGNIATLMAKPDVDGALVGGASLDADEFALIARYRLHPSTPGASQRGHPETQRDGLPHNSLVTMQRRLPCAYGNARSGRASMTRIDAWTGPPRDGAWAPRGRRPRTGTGEFAARAAAREGGP